MALSRLLQRWRDHLIPAQNAVVRQWGAIPYTLVDGRVSFLLITSRGGGRWIFPKGGAIKGLTPWQVAEREAYEEAGIEGEVETVPIGAYNDTKAVGTRRLTIEVGLYPLRMVRLLEAWPEQRERQRQWTTLPETERLLANTRLRELVTMLERRLAREAAGPRAP
jgi:8-oxo-dGTP pyrophosphatase MutT (NUDIX family)